MKKEELVALGIEEEVASKILSIHGKDIEKFKTDLETAKTQISEKDTQLTEANKTIESFKDIKPEELKKAAEDWKLKAEQAQKDAEERISKMKFDNSLETALKEARAKNPKAVKGLLNLENLKLGDEDKIVGLAEQLEKIQKDNDYMFDKAPEEKDPKLVLGGHNDKVISDSVINAAREAAGLKVATDK